MRFCFLNVFIGKSMVFPSIFDKIIKKNSNNEITVVVKHKFYMIYKILFKKKQALQS